MNILIIIFFFFILLVLHTYVIYPFSIKLLTVFYKKKYKIDENYKPHVSILISAFNEEQVIENTISTLLESDYPHEKMEIIIGSDNSTDSTNEILKKMSQRFNNLIFIPFDKRRGKKFVINDLVKFAAGEILIFCDANTLYKKDAIKNMIKYYTDSRIGGVCGRLKLLESSDDFEAGNQEKKYWDYESWIKMNEGKVGILIGANGGIYSIRKNLFIPMPEKEPVVDDLYLSLKILEAGYDFIYTQESEAIETISPKVQSEFDRKVRIMPRSLETIKKTKPLIFSKRFLISYALWSHKIFRWASPVFFIIILILNTILFQLNDFLKVLLFLQAFFYLCIFIGFVLNKLKLKITFFMMMYYFFITNAALLVGLKKYLFNTHKSIWNPTPRS